VSFAGRENGRDEPHRKGFSENLNKGRKKCETRAGVFKRTTEEDLMILWIGVGSTRVIADPYYLSHFSLRSSNDRREIEPLLPA
jgi:hypothetical protein